MTVGEGVKMKSESATLKSRVSMLLSRHVNGYCRLTNLISLTYCCVDALGRPCDRLCVSFDHVSGIAGGASYDIASRTYDAIIREVQTAFADYMLEVTDRVIRDLNAGYSSK